MTKMATNSLVYDRIRELILTGLEDGLHPGDEAMLRSNLREATHADLYALVEAFFDVELLVVAIYEQFRADGSRWPSNLREKLVESLTFCGLDAQAEQVSATLV
jgi:hypothetical protein